MARLVDEMQTSFARGIVTNYDRARPPADGCVEIKNGLVMDDGSIIHRGGTKKTLASPLVPGGGGAYGLSNFVWPLGSSLIYKHLAFCGDRAFDVNATLTSATDITPETMGVSDLTEGFYTFATMQVGSDEYLFAANGNENIWRWNGSGDLEPLPNAPAGVKYVAVFNGRLWAAGHNGSIVQASAIADPENWTHPGALTVRVSTPLSHPIMGLFQVGPHLLVFDRYSTAYIDGYGESTLVVATGATGFARSVGCIAPRSIQAVGNNGVVWLSERGLEHYSPGSGIQLLTEHCRDLWHEVAISPFFSGDRACGLYVPLTNHYHLFSEWKDRHLAVNLTTGGTSLCSEPAPTESVSAIVPAGNLQVSPDQYLFFTLRNDGHLYRHGAGKLDDVNSDGSGGTPVELDVQSRHFHLGSIRAPKRFRAAHAVVSTLERANPPSTAGVKLGFYSDEFPAPEGKSIEFFLSPQIDPHVNRVKVQGSVHGDHAIARVTSTDMIRVEALGVSGAIRKERGV